MKNIVEVKKLIKKYDSKFELGPINLDIPGGMIVGLIGKNGAGKTTFMKSILSLISIDSGSIKIFGKEYTDDSIKEDIGVVLSYMFLPELLSAKDIHFIMKDIYKRWDRDLYFYYLKEFDISVDKKLKELSKGMRKKVEIAVSLSHHPKLLLLDEATSGLDPVVREEILDIFLKFVSDEEHSILFSTHITSDLEHIADCIIFINQGKIVLSENRDSILDYYGVLKCDKDYFSSICKEDILVYTENKYNYHILVKDKNNIKKKYKDCVVDAVNLDEFMILMIKGEKIC